MELLIVVPTEPEFRGISAQSISPQIGLVICGAGLVSAATGTARILAVKPPKAILLMGICGAYANAGLSQGSVVRVESSYLADFGAFDHDGSLLGAEQLDLGQARWNSSPVSEFPEVLPDLRSRFLSLPAAQSASVQAACGTNELAEHRAHIAMATIEEMEGAAVLSVAEAFRVPVFHVRAVSNRAGTRNRAEWRLDLALQGLHDWLHGVS